MKLHHVQVACPVGGEEIARRFWVEGIGLTEVAKPSDLAGRGGAWFRACTAAVGAGGIGTIALEIHVGVEDPFAPARKAHPAILFDGVADLDRADRRLVRLGFDVDRSQRLTFPGYQRLHVVDGHGNRVELLAQ